MFETQARVVVVGLGRGKEHDHALRSQATLRFVDQVPADALALMVDIDARSEAAGWPYTPRPEAGFAASPAFAPTSAVHDAFEAGFADLRDLVWGELPTVTDAIEEVRANTELL